MTAGHDDDGLYGATYRGCIPAGDFAIHCLTRLARDRSGLPVLVNPIYRGKPATNSPQSFLTLEAENLVRLLR